ncbi:LamG domain-containing protein [Streptomyces sp. NBC_01142]|uniref:LamG domain-containing protein n=1 Tax=Streptomyces sp. NBC_01142 TaxID=2975865 RepID=UPI002257C718|nr:LamG domain-containing protein [Streptomyces sp. NBC_01142]MCX4825998.1 LamG domain-containing protein [Streptomyces sp. NBC_01142]
MRACMRGGAAVVTAFVTVFSALALPAAAAGAAVGDAPALSEGQQALAQAVESGKRVEVTGERSEQTTVFANPDGYTFTLEESAVPVRVATPNGGWQAPDPTLERRSDGSVGPKAATVKMTFSGGGDHDPLVQIGELGQSLELSWLGRLPEPELDGSSALYREVLPDIDVKVTATAESFQHVLVVKSPKAASRPELKELEFGLKATGLTVRKGAAGSLAAVDGDGNTVFRAPPAQMWNSAGKMPTQQPHKTQRSSALPAAEGQAVPGDASERAASGSGLEPGQGDRVARMDVKLGEYRLSVVPDADMLATTETAAFPLFIDPTVTWGESERTLLRSDGYESYGWGNGDDGQGMGVGKCGTWSGYYCGPGYVQRLYFEFSPASLKGKQVLDATFRVTEPWAFQCDPRWVDLVRTNNISSSTSWSSRPKELDWMGDKNVSAGRGSLCDPDSPEAPIEFHDNLPDEPNENLTPTVRDFAAGKFSRLTLEIRANNESDPSAWKRFKNDATLAVDFVGLPAKPTGIGLMTGSGAVCDTSASDPAIVSDPTPAMTATAQTASGGEKDAQLRVAMAVEKKASNGTWSNAITEMEAPSTGYVGDNIKLSKAVPDAQKLSEGTLYRYRSWTRSYYNGGKSHLSGPSNASTTGWCYFKVDPSAPLPPQITIGAPYTACTASDCAPKGGPGVKGTFTFKPAAGDTNVVAFQYRLTSGGSWSDAKKVCAPNTPAPMCANAASTAFFVLGWQAAITPERSGTYRLSVRAKDNVDRFGAQNVVDFLVAAGDGPVGRWHFNEAGGTAVDSATGGSVRRDATLAGGAARDDRGRRGLITHDSKGNVLEAPVTDKGLSLNGSTGYAATSGPVLETRSSYTVSAWVRVDPDTAKTLTVLSQTAETTSPFSKKYSPLYLSYGGGSNTWSMRVLTGEGTFQEAKAKQPSPRDVWTHVAGVHDAVEKKVSFYLNGQFQSSVAWGTPFSADGPLQIGRVMYADAYRDYMHGSIDEVAVWQRELTEKEVADEARLLTSDKYAGAELVADWSASRESGTTIADSTSGYGKALALSGGASLEGEEIVLDGVDGAATAAGPLVDDTGSFTVTALAALDGAKLLSKDVGYTGQVLGQRTADGSAWGFWFQLTGKKTVLDGDMGEEKTVPAGFWHFGRLNTDGTFSSVTSSLEAALDTPVRLTGLFDAQAGRISLYLAHDQNGADQEFTAKAGAGDFAIGRGFTSGGWKHYLPGRISEVRLWAGAMASHTQIENSVGD